MDSGADNETILAALFHDIGHICPSDSIETMGIYGVADHDKIGYQFLRMNGMSEKVCQLVLGHVQAKRYLTGIDSEYFANLSEASQATLLLQGGPMSPSEVADFELDPLFNAKINMRSWDEQAKVVGLSVPDIDFYRPMLFKHLENQF